MEHFIEATLITLDEDDILRIILKLDVGSILNLCEVHSKFNQFCHTDYIWKQLLKRDYPNTPIVGDPRQHYMKLYKNIYEHYPSRNINLLGNTYPPGTYVLITGYIIKIGNELFSQYVQSFNDKDAIEKIFDVVDTALESLENIPFPQDIIIGIQQLNNDEDNEIEILAEDYVESEAELYESIMTEIHQLDIDEIFHVVIENIPFYIDIYVKSYVL